MALKLDARFKEHRISGQSILPGAASLEALLATSQKEIMRRAVAQPFVTSHVQRIALQHTQATNSCVSTQTICVQRASTTRPIASAPFYREWLPPAGLQYGPSFAVATSLRTCGTRISAEVVGDDESACAYTGLAPGVLDAGLHASRARDVRQHSEKGTTGGIAQHQLKVPSALRAIVAMRRNMGQALHTLHVQVHDDGSSDYDFRDNADSTIPVMIVGGLVTKSVATKHSATVADADAKVTCAYEVAWRTAITSVPPSMRGVNRQDESALSLTIGKRCGHVFNVQAHRLLLALLDVVQTRDHGYLRMLTHGALLTPIFEVTRKRNRSSSSAVGAWAALHTASLELSLTTTAVACDGDDLSSAKCSVHSAPRLMSTRGGFGVAVRSGSVSTAQLVNGPTERSVASVSDWQDAFHLIAPRCHPILVKRSAARRWASSFASPCDSVAVADAKVTCAYEVAWRTAITSVPPSMRGVNRQDESALSLTIGKRCGHVFNVQAHRLLLALLDVVQTRDHGYLRMLTHGALLTPIFEVTRKRNRSSSSAVGAWAALHTASLELSLTTTAVACDGDDLSSAKCSVHSAPRLMSTRGGFGVAVRSGSVSTAQLVNGPTERSVASVSDWQDAFHLIAPRCHPILVKRSAARRWASSFASPCDSVAVADAKVTCAYEVAWRTAITSVPPSMRGVNRQDESALSLTIGKRCGHVFNVQAHRLLLALLDVVQTRDHGYLRMLTHGALLTPIFEVTRKRNRSSSSAVGAWAALHTASLELSLTTTAVACDGDDLSSAKCSVHSAPRLMSTRGGFGVAVRSGSVSTAQLVNGPTERSVASVSDWQDAFHLIAPRCHPILVKRSAARRWASSFASPCDSVADADAKVTCAYEVAWRTAITSVPPSMRGVNRQDESALSLTMGKRCGHVFNVQAHRLLLALLDVVQTRDHGYLRMLTHGALLTPIFEVTRKRNRSSSSAVGAWAALHTASLELSLTTTAVACDGDDLSSAKYDADATSAVSNPAPPIAPEESPLATGEAHVLIRSSFGTPPEWQPHRLSLVGTTLELECAKGSSKLALGKFSRALLVESSWVGDSESCVALIPNSSASTPVNRASLYCESEITVLRFENEGDADAWLRNLTLIISEIEAARASLKDATG
ncbi:hypothetical protein PPROV_000142700 [Pycnococcus provasolii]|uniref:Uncharacterized protein n=1 Tax=Pycnococcus provasolii TaxID=41880 RepID=A0A830HAQ1_9CHLO|nr:hypothetical protein PPROV_000142700 [Pycnococcus provasolii]